MCGIFGFTGSKDAMPIILKGLSRLEYRGYDSAWVCVVSKKNEFRINKAVGKVMELKNKMEWVDVSGYMAGIGHTRWATHGGVTENNCHPHTSENGRFAVVHNGIIENYSILKKKMQNKKIRVTNFMEKPIQKLLLNFLNLSSMEMISKHSGKWFPL